jgi:hypothetical protein
MYYVFSPFTNNGTSPQWNQEAQIAREAQYILRLTFHPADAASHEVLESAAEGC